MTCNRRGWLGRIVAALVAAVVMTAIPAQAPLARAAASDITLTQLPREAREVFARIPSGGPFAYGRDGTVFGNRERALPPHARGYYHEFTVPTPGARTRGTRRIICGGPKRAPDVCYYTDDHYQSFRRIRP